LADFLCNFDATYTIDIEQLASAFWSQYNSDAEFTVDIKEMTPTGNMEVSEMLARKIQWKTVDDDKLGPSRISRGNDWNAITLEAQRIRVFDLEFTKGDSNPLFLV